MSLIKGKQIESINASQVIVNDELQFVSKAEKELWNSNSENTIPDSVLDTIDEVNRLKHSHDNKDIIDKLSVDNGKLLFDGREIEGTATEGPKGEDGKSVELTVEDGYIKWRLAGQEPEAEWINLISLSDITGQDGLNGQDGEKGDPFTYDDFTPEQLEALRGPQGIQGPQGARGERGERGEQGPEGPAGQDGITQDISHLVSKEELANAVNLNNYYTKNESYNKTEVDTMLSGLGNGNMKQEIYDTNNNGIVDLAENINGIQSSSPLTYYGKNSDGEIGFHYFPINKDETDGIYQRVKLKALANQSFEVDLLKNRPKNDILIQVLEFKPGQQNITKVLKEFNNGDELNFVFNEENVIFDGKAKIKDKYDINSIKSESECESELISTSDYEFISKIIQEVI